MQPQNKHQSEKKTQRTEWQATVWDVSEQKQWDSEQKLTLPQPTVRAHFTESDKWQQQMQLQLFLERQLFQWHNK